MAQVSVTGSGAAEFEPEVAQVHVTFTSTVRSRERSIDEVVSKSNTLAQWAEPVAGVVLRAQTVAFHGTAEKKIGYTASLHRSVEFHGSAIEHLPDLLARAAGELGAGLDGPHWELTAPTVAMKRREVTRLAVTAAREQAESYADALDLRLGDLVSIGDAGRGGVMASARMARGVSFSSAGLATLADLDLAPQPVEVHVTAQATWELVAR